MKRLSKPHPNQPNFSWDVDSPARTARLRMVELPTDDSRDPKQQAIFPREDFWVPVAVVNGNVHILPGVPRLCEIRPESYHLLNKPLNCYSPGALRGPKSDHPPALGRSWREGHMPHPHLHAAARERGGSVPDAARREGRAEGR